MKVERLAIIVPMKSLREAKQRLRPVLDEDERLALARSMLVHVLATVENSDLAHPAIVISPDPDVLALAKLFDFWLLLETEPGYNEAAAEAIAWAHDQGADAVLVLPADLPHLTPADLYGLVDLAAAHDNAAPGAAVIAPDAAETGSNALLLHPPDLLSPAFGPDSFTRHCALAQAAGVIPAIYRSPTLAHDIDLPEDLGRLEEGLLIRL